MPEYVKVAQANELEPNHGKLVEVQGKKIALFNVDGKFHAIDNTWSLAPGMAPSSRSAPARCSARRRRKGWAPTKSG